MTDRWSLLRATTSAALLTDLAGEYDVPAEAVLRGTGLTPSSLAEPDGEIRAAQELELVRNLVRELGHVPALGLEAGTRYHASTHGIMGFAVLSSPTIRQALEVGVRYFRLSFTFADLLLDPVEGGVRLTLDDRETPSEVREFQLERDVAALATMQRDLVGTAMPTRQLELAATDRGYRDRFEEITGNVPVFGASTTYLVLDDELLDLPLPQANPHTAALCERQCAELLQRRLERRGVSGRVRDLLARMAAGDQEDVARELNTSVRTLRRQLSDEGTSFRELSGEVRCLLAEELLGAGLAVEDVAHRLGFSTASAFTHAYKRWRGTTPGRYARSTRARSA